jgi:hypothetical protein
MKSVSELSRSTDACFREPLFTKFFILQKRYFEISVHKREIGALKDKKLSKRTPNSLKCFSCPSLWIRSICEIKLGSVGLPSSLLLNTSLPTFGSITFPRGRKTLNLVLDIFITNLLVSNQFIVFCSSSFT